MLQLVEVASKVEIVLIEQYSVGVGGTGTWTGKERERERDNEICLKNV